MIFSTEKRFIFFAAGKTGTTSIDRSLKVFADAEKDPKIIFRTRHVPPRDVKAAIDEATWNAMFKFAFVRKPWDWVLSAYFFNRVRHGRFPLRQLRKAGILGTPRVFGRREFEEHWEMMKRFRRGTHPENRFQYSFLADEDGRLLIDHVGRYETLQSDYDTISDRIGVPRHELPHANPGQARKQHQRHYTELYTDEARELVANHYAKDIAYFGYQFGGRAQEAPEPPRPAQRDRRPEEADLCDTRSTAHSHRRKRSDR